MKVGVGTAPALAFVSALSLAVTIFVLSSTFYNDKGQESTDFLIDDPNNHSSDQTMVLRAEEGVNETVPVTVSAVATDQNNKKRWSWAAANVFLSIALMGIASALVLVNFEESLATHASISLPYHVPKTAAQALVIGMRVQTAQSKFFARLAGLFAIVVILWVVSVVWGNMTSLGYIDFASLVLMIAFIALFAARFLGHQQKNFVLIALVSVSLWFGALATARIAMELTMQSLRASKRFFFYLLGLLIMGIQLLFLKYILPFLKTQANKIVAQVFN